MYRSKWRLDLYFHFLRLVPKETYNHWNCLHPNHSNLLLYYARTLQSTRFQTPGVSEFSGSRVDGLHVVTKNRDTAGVKFKDDTQDKVFDFSFQKTFLRELSGKNLDFKKENIWTVPNLLCMLRIAASPYIGYLIVTQEYTWACGLLAVAGFTDLIDGVIARRFPSQSSRLGSILDPFADKCLMSVLCITLSFVNLIPLPLTVLIISRDLLLVGASFYIRYITLPQPRTWTKFWDIQRSAIEVTPSLISKINTVIQILLVGITVGAPVFHYIDHPLLHTLWYLTAGTTLASGLSYITQMKGFRVLRKKTHNTP